MAISLVIADDHPIVLDGLEQLFRMERDVVITARARDGKETLQAVHDHRPDVLVLDVRMPAMDGLGILRILRDEGIDTRVVLLTVSLEEEQLVEAVRLGVAGVVLKEMAPQILVEAVRRVHAGGEYLEGGVVGRALRRMVQREQAGRDAARVLTPREIEIIGMLANGLRNRAIAEKLFISEGTVKVHLHRIYEKLDVGGRLELVLYARNKGLV
ncbi:MAG TPA: response regulator transcription factor [Candidatus Polarisedimenticolaceae bacterium]|nr:response regulator transcription factor [Candidatus Polarisedimenticolaceae bacterium]